MHLLLFLESFINITDVFDYVTLLTMMLSVYYNVTKVTGVCYNVFDVAFICYIATLFTSESCCSSAQTIFSYNRHLRLI